MNKTTLALVVAGSLALGTATPGARAASTSSTSSTSGTTSAASVIQTLNTAEMSANQFKTLFTPYNNPIASAFRFDGGTTDAGVIESQVFKGTGAADGLFAYAYQVAVNNATAGGDPVHVDSTSFKFNSTPLGTDLTKSGQPNYGYIVKDGAVGGLTLPGTQAPTTLSWQPGVTTGYIRAQYVDPAKQVQPVGAGSNSATFVLITKQLPADVTPSVNIGGASATTTVPIAYTTSTGQIAPIPVPEPATFLAWSGMAAGVALVRRVRKARATA